MPTPQSSSSKPRKGSKSRSVASATSGGNKARKTSGATKPSKGTGKPTSSSGSVGLIDIDLPTLIEQFGTEDKCHDFLSSLRWPDGVRCLNCGSEKISYITTRRIYECSMPACRYQFSVRKGTIFEDSKLPLWKWLLATYLMVESRKGISANQVSRMFRVTYKTSWYLCHRIRNAMTNDDPTMLGGVVEVDETFIGGKHTFRRYGEAAFSGRSNMVVMGAIQRGGNVRLRVRTQRNKIGVHGFVHDVADDNAEAIYADGFAGYRGLTDHNTRHETVYHERHEYVRGEAHTNTCESVWSLFKRLVIGTFHQLSFKDLPAYLAEAQWRFNNRENRCCSKTPCANWSLPTG